MPIEEAVLEATARAYVAPMSSIRGRRVHRLLMRELARFDHVLAVTTDDGPPALLAIGADGRAAVCRTDGRARRPPSPSGAASKARRSPPPTTRARLAPGRELDDPAPELRGRRPGAHDL